MRLKRNIDTAFWYANAEIIFQSESKPVKNLAFKLDTGARVTTIPSQLLIANGVTKDKIEQGMEAMITVADGRYVPNSYMFRVAEIHILGKNFRNFEVATSLSANMGLLLGQNILECFDWDINYSTGFALAKFRDDFIPKPISNRSKAVSDLNLMEEFEQ